MAKRNYINSGVSDSDLISLASNLQASQLAVPEKTTWDYIQEDLEEWQVAVKGRAAKFMEDLPDEFDLNKVEPEGRESISTWYKSMRKDFMKAANKASLFDPGSFAYGEGSSKMNTIEDNLSSVNGVFDNIKAVRTQAIKDKDNYASGVPASQTSMMEAIVSGEMFNGMVIKDGGIQFKVEGATYPDGQDHFTEEDIKNLRTKGSKSEEGINGIMANAEDDMFNGVAFKPGSYRNTIESALNLGNKTSENQDLMLDVGGINEDGSLNAEPYVTKWLKAHPNDTDFKDLKSIKENLSDFYSQNKDDFIDNFLMTNARNVHKNTEIGEKAKDALLKAKLQNDQIEQSISASQTSQANTRSIINARENKGEKEEKDIEKQNSNANKVLEGGGNVFNHGIYNVEGNDEGGYKVSYKEGNTNKLKIFKKEEDLRNFLNIERTEEGKARLLELNELKIVDYAKAKELLEAIIYKPNEYIKSKKEGSSFYNHFAKGPSETIKYIRSSFSNEHVKATQFDGDTIELTIDGVSKTFVTSPIVKREKKAKAMLQWISDNLNK